MIYRPVTQAELQNSRNLLEKAGESLEQGDRRAALEQLREAFRENPNNDELPLMGAMILQEDGDFAAAAGEALDALEVRPQNPVALNMLGVLCNEGHRPDLAQGLFRRVIRLAPGYKVARRNLKDARRYEKELRKKGAATQVADFPDERIRKLDAGDALALTLCILADDSDRLEETLLSVRDLDAQVVVLDTSAAIESDTKSDTVVLAVPWCREPADAFNYGLAISRTGWVLFLNAGERLEDRFGATLSERLSDRDAIGHPVAVGSASPMRLVRNLSKIVYEGSGEPDPSSSIAELCRAWRVTAGSSGLRVRAACVDPEGPAAGRGDEIKAIWSRIQKKEYAGALDDAARLRESCEQAGPPLELEAEAPATLEGYCLMRLERFEELRERMERFSCRFRPTANTLFLHGLAQKAMGDPVQAVKMLSKALARPDQGRHFGALPEVAGPGLPNILGAARIDLRDFSGGAFAFEAALDREPDNTEAALGLLVIHAGENQMEQVLRDLDALVARDPDNEIVWTMGATILEDMPGMGEAAQAWLEEAVLRFPDRPGLKNRLGMAYLTCGQGDKALTAWSDLADPGSAGLAGRVAASVLEQSPLPDVPGVMAGEVTAYLLGWMGKWMQAEAYQSLDLFLNNVDAALPVLPELGGNTADWLERVGQTEAAANLRTRIG